MVGTFTILPCDTAHMGQLNMLFAEQVKMQLWGKLVKFICNTSFYFCSEKTVLVGCTGKRV